MRDLGLEATHVETWFEREQGEDDDILLFRVSDETAQGWIPSFVDGVRRCYISDAALEARSANTGISKEDLLAAVLPDPGATMSGDFGEIVAFVFLASAETAPYEVIGPKKWSLKEDRTRPAPRSDVVQFVVPAWPEASEHDRLICAEVKAKATKGGWEPIPAAIAGSEKDRLNRLASTLVWLKERALLTDIGTTSIEILERFIRAVDHPKLDKRFWAVVVICNSLLDDELAAASVVSPDECSLAVISVPGLKSRYESVYEAVRSSMSGHAA